MVLVLLRWSIFMEDVMFLLGFLFHDVIRLYATVLRVCHIKSAVCVFQMSITLLTEIVSV